MWTFTSPNHTCQQPLDCCMHADEYQPPCFKAADASLVAHFTRKPFTMDVGVVNTNHHNVGLKVGWAIGS